MSTLYPQQFLDITHSPVRLTDAKILENLSDRFGNEEGYFTGCPLCCVEFT